MASYSFDFLGTTYNPSDENVKAAKLIDKMNANLYNAVCEWIADGWGYHDIPSPVMIAAALLNEAETQKAMIHDERDPEEREGMQESLSFLIETAKDILKCYVQE